MNKFIEAISSGKIIMAAHRGNKTSLPENTMPAFRRAIEVGSDGIETDLRQTKDGVIVLIHDLMVDRTTDGTGRVCDMTLEELRAFDAGIKFGEEYRGTRIPTLEEFIDLVADHDDLLLNLEIKDYPEELGDFAYSSADKIIAMVEERGISDRVMLNCFSRPMLSYLHKKYPSYPLHGFYPEFLMKGSDENVYPALTYVCLFNVYKNEEGKTVRLTEPVLPREDFERVKNELGCEACVCFAVDTPEKMQTAIERGATMFTCNDPELGISILKSLGYRD